MAQPYAPPAFVDATDFIDGVPTSFIPLARRVTPLERWLLPGLPEDTDLWIKRDDTTGDVLLSGNKVRKLEFLLAEAIQQGADTCITAGGTQSNHARATVAACRRIGIQPHLVLRDDSENQSEPCSGNLFLDRTMGAEVSIFPRLGYSSIERLQEARVALEANGRRPYIVPVGGSNPLGCWGYIEAFAELQTQWCRQMPTRPRTALVGAVGSGATVLGMAVSNQQYQKCTSDHSIDVYGYTVCDSPDYFHDFFDLTMSNLLSANARRKSRDVVELRDAAGLGYGKVTSDELQFLSRVARETGVLLDPSYTNKVAMRMVADINAGAFADHRAMIFVHTGGAAGTFAQASKILSSGP